MRAGLLNELVEVWKPEVTNQHGEQVTDYSFTFRCKARVLSANRSRSQEMGEVYYPMTRTIEVRMYQQIGDYDRIVMRGRTYRILSVEIDRSQQCKRMELEEVNE